MEGLKSRVEHMTEGLNIPPFLFLSTFECPRLLDKKIKPQTGSDVTLIMHISTINTHKWLFHSFETVLCPADKPHNPMVNAGAIVCTSLIKVRCSYRSQRKI